MWFIVIVRKNITNLLKITNGIYFYKDVTYMYSIIFLVPVAAPVTAAEAPRAQRLRRDTSYGHVPHAPHKSYSKGRVGPVYTFVKTDYNGNFKWGVRHRAGSEYAGGYHWSLVWLHYTANTLLFLVMKWRPSVIGTTHHDTTQPAVTALSAYPSSLNTWPHFPFRTVSGVHIELC